MNAEYIVNMQVRVDCERACAYDVHMAGTDGLRDPLGDLTDWRLDWLRPVHVALWSRPCTRECSECGAEPCRDRR